MFQFFDNLTKVTMKYFYMSVCFYKMTIDDMEERHENKFLTIPSSFNKDKIILPLILMKSEFFETFENRKNFLNFLQGFNWIYCKV